MMMALGMYVFAMDSTPYQQLQQQVGWRHPSTSRVGTRPARQFLGLDDEAITLTGYLSPEITGGETSLELLRSMGNTGESYALIEGTGKVWGVFIITKLDMTRQLFFSDGAARRIDFTLSLARTDEGDGLLANRSRLNGA